MSSSPFIAFFVILLLFFSFIYFWNFHLSLISLRSLPSLDLLLCNFLFHIYIHSHTYIYINIFYTNQQENSSFVFESIHGVRRLCQNNVYNIFFLNLTYLNTTKSLKFYKLFEPHRHVQAMRK